MHISNKCSIAVHCLIFLSEYGEREKVTSELFHVRQGATQSPFGISSVP